MPVRTRTNGPRKGERYPLAGSGKIAYMQSLLKPLEWERDDSDTHDGNPTWMLKDETGKPTGVAIHISDGEDDDGDPQYEIWEADDKSGDSETFEYAKTMDAAIRKAKRYMKENPRGGYNRTIEMKR